jgi:hypothetical protein
MYLKVYDGQPGGGNYDYLINPDGTGRHEIYLAGFGCVEAAEGCAWNNWGMVVPAATGGGPGPMVNATRVKVPPVHTLSYATATKRLVSAHLSVGTVARQYNSAIPAGHVIKQYPLAGSVAHRTRWKGPPVNLVLSRGPKS